MSIHEFVSALKVLKAFYIDWQFDFADKIQVSTWHAYLQGMDLQKFEKVINYYISNHDVGPNNPGDLLRAQIEYNIKQKILEGNGNDY